MGVGMKNKKGFTLIEITAVVVVLAIIALLITPVVTKVINKNRNKVYDDQINGIVASAKVWGAEHIGSLPGIGESDVTITLDVLQKGGYAKAELVNPSTNELFDPLKTKIVIKNNNGNLIYKVVIE